MAEDNASNFEPTKPEGDDPLAPVLSDSSTAGTTSDSSSSESDSSKQPTSSPAPESQPSSAALPTGEDAAPTSEPSPEADPFTGSDGVPTTSPDAPTPADESPAPGGDSGTGLSVDDGSKVVEALTGEADKPAEDALEQAPTASPASEPEAVAPPPVLDAQKQDESSPDSSAEKADKGKDEQALTSQAPNPLSYSGAPLNWPVAAEKPNPVHPCSGLPLLDDPDYADSEIVQILQGAIDSEGGDDAAPQENDDFDSDFDGAARDGDDLQAMAEDALQLASDLQVKVQDLLSKLVS